MQNFFDIFQFPLKKGRLLISSAFFTFCFECGRIWGSLPRISTHNVLLHMVFKKIFPGDFFHLILPNCLTISSLWWMFSPWRLFLPHKGSISSRQKNLPSTSRLWCYPSNIALNFFFSCPTICLGIIKSTHNLIATFPHISSYVIEIVGENRFLGSKIRNKVTLCRKSDLASDTLCLVKKKTTSHWEREKKNACGNGLRKAVHTERHQPHESWESLSQWELVFEELKFRGFGDMFFSKGLPQTFTACRSANIKICRDFLISFLLLRDCHFSDPAYIFDMCEGACIKDVVFQMTNNENLEEVIYGTVWFNSIWNIEPLSRLFYPRGNRFSGNKIDTC